MLGALFIVYCDIIIYVRLYLALLALRLLQMTIQRQCVLVCVLFDGAQMKRVALSKQREEHLRNHSAHLRANTKHNLTLKLKVRLYISKVMWRTSALLGAGCYVYTAHSNAFGNAIMCCTHTHKHAPTPTSAWLCILCIYGCVWAMTTSPHTLTLCGTLNFLVWRCLDVYAGTHTYECPRSFSGSLAISVFLTGSERVAERTMYPPAECGK